MSTPISATGNETHIRAIVFRDGEIYVAQCLEYDISAQGQDIESVLDRLEMTVDAEFEACAAAGVKPCECISAAPVYYHSLWNNRMFNIARVNVETPTNAPVIEVALAKAA